ncbi:hypothetical protein BDV97DRAFT_106610 [Delphinella strobiligena]|nr:hypothetical protein BDV97DRAFT_106610 [Delphinella strobiligena]
MPQDRSQLEKRRRASEGTLSQLAEQVHFDFIHSLFEVSLESPVSPHSTVWSSPIDEEAFPTRAESASLDLCTPSPNSTIQTERSSEWERLLGEVRRANQVQLNHHDDLQQPSEAKTVVSSSSFPFPHEASRYCFPITLPGTAREGRSGHPTTISPSLKVRTPSKLAISDVRERDDLRGEDYIAHIIRCQESPGTYKRYIDDFLSLDHPSPDKISRSGGKKKR